MNITTLSQCMDIFVWFDDNLFDYLSHILLAKLDGEQRIQRALPNLIEHATDLIAAHKHTEAAYPTEFLNQQPA